MFRSCITHVRDSTTTLLAVSVVIPTLRESARISTLLHALRHQSYDGPLQIIVADGGSEDDTLRIAHSVPGVLCLSCERGTARQRNAGAHAAEADLLIFMDADNMPGPHFVRDVVRSFQHWSFGVACPWFVARETIPIRAAYMGFNLLFWLGQGWLRTGSGVCLVTPREVWKKCGGFREEMHLGEDIDFLRRAARWGGHRHLLVPLETSGRRFERDGVLRLLFFYARISPLILLGRWNALQRLEYRAAEEELSTPKQTAPQAGHTKENA
ncbi:MAG: hypothetical protein JWN98_1729 [Abditibacteriota bacterium]|nr:hypothetical protein [Abditibacteriota bacterium]